MGTTNASLIGQLLERRYRVDGVIAHGGMSTVYRGMDTRLGRPIAIKVMDRRLADDRSFVDRFDREARAAAQLHHSGVVGVYDQGVEPSSAGDHVFLVMELVAGGTLRDILRNHGPLSVPMAVTIMDAVLAALAAAHRAGLVHRDVKPENVLIGQDGAIKVGDFGLVKAMANATVTSSSTILGTVAYLSPEQVAQGSADARSDVYSAGIMLYEMLTGVAPYNGDTAISVAYRHVNDTVPAPGRVAVGIPSELDDLVLRATSKNPADRPADAAEFSRELRQVANLLRIPKVAIPVPASGNDSAPPQGGEPETTRFNKTLVASSQETVGPQGTRVFARPNYAQEETPPAKPALSDDELYERQRQRSRRVFFIWIAVILVLAALVGTAAWWFGTGQWTLMPAVKGVAQSIAEQRVRDADLTAQVTTVAENDIPAGQVVDANPGEGQRVHRGTVVTLMVSQGKPRVPSFTPGADQDAVNTQIQQAGLSPVHDQNKDQFDDTVAQGTVLGLSPTPGTTLTVGAPVTVILSKGPAPRQVPSVAGMSKDAAFAALTKAGFTPFDAGTEFSDQVDSGKVTRTSPPAGASIDAGAQRRIGVFTSNAVTMPMVIGQQVQEAVKALQKLGLNVQLNSFFRKEDGRVIAQDVSAGTRVQPGTTITLTSFP